MTPAGHMAPAGHMTPEEFRRHGHALIDWLAAYMERVGELPIQPALAPGEILDRLPSRAPEEGEPFAAIMADLDEIVMPGLTHWQSPGWFAFFPANTSGPSILGELAAAGLGVQGMLWATSPAATEIEMRVLDWLVELLGLPQSFTHAGGRGGGVIQMSASDSTHLAHVVARTLASARGASCERLVAYASSQAHSSIEKGARVAGFGHVRLLDVDERFALAPEALEAAIVEDLAAGLTPAILTSTIGTTATGAVDPIARLAPIARAHGLWHHVDAAWAGSAMICPERRGAQAGVEQVDSYTFNPHKWLLTNFDCNVMWVADRRPLVQAMSILPPYLRGAASRSERVVDFRDWHVPLGRRFRALKLWWVLRYYGAAGLRRQIEGHIALADALGRWIQSQPQLELIAPVSFALVCFCHRDGDRATDRLLEAINASGEAYLTGSTIAQRRFIRVSIGQPATTGEHVARLAQLIGDALG
jgi:aromatic-L-amino-acid decarboxylase